MHEVPVARSPIEPTPPVDVRAGWAVSVLGSSAALRLADRTALTKVLVRGDARSRVGATLDVPPGRARRDLDGTLVIASGPGEWLLLAPPQSLETVTDGIDDTNEELVSVVDVTHGRALMRLSGRDAPSVLAKVCAIDLSDTETPDGSALRSSVAKVATDVVRDDISNADTVERSYLLHCERSLGQYLFDALLDAGREFGIEVEGFSFEDVRPRGR